MPATGHNVYILGAGFSAFANMPCIDDFLERMQDLREFSDRLSPGAASAIGAVLSERSNASSVREKIQVNLDNIEQLFSLIDAASRPSAGTDLTENQKAIRKAIAATLLGSTSAPKPIHCSTGPNRPHQLLPLIPGAKETPGSNADLEVSPYALFAAMVSHRLDTFDPKLLATDTVITFNYDLVLEEAFRSLSINPDYLIPNARYPSALAPNAESPKLIKLHGSINWGLEDSASDNISVFEEPSELIDRADSYPVLLPPTWNKGSFVQTLGPLWSTAIDALRGATRIVLIGYSMPDTDIDFKYFLASGLLNNHWLRSFVIINPSDLSSQYGSFFDATYFRKRLVAPGINPGMRDNHGSKFEEFIASSWQFHQAVGRGSLLREDR